MTNLQGGDSTDWRIHGTGYLYDSSTELDCDSYRRCGKSESRYRSFAVILELM